MNPRCATRAARRQASWCQASARIVVGDLLGGHARRAGARRRARRRAARRRRRPRSSRPAPGVRAPGGGRGVGQQRLVLERAADGDVRPAGGRPADPQQPPRPVAQPGALLVAVEHGDVDERAVGAGGEVAAAVALVGDHSLEPGQRHPGAHQRDRDPAPRGARRGRADEVAHALTDRETDEQAGEQGQQGVLAGEERGDHERRHDDPGRHEPEPALADARHDEVGRDAGDQRAERVGGATGLGESGQHPGDLVGVQQERVQPGHDQDRRGDGEQRVEELASAPAQDEVDADRDGDAEEPETDDEVDDEEQRSRAAAPPRRTAPGRRCRSSGWRWPRSPGAAPAAAATRGSAGGRWGDGSETGSGASTTSTPASAGCGSEGAASLPPSVTARSCHGRRVAPAASRSRSAPGPTWRRLAPDGPGCGRAPDAVRRARPRPGRTHPPRQGRDLRRRRRRRRGVGAVGGTGDEPVRVGSPVVAGDQGGRLPAARPRGRGRPSAGGRSGCRSGSRASASTSRGAAGLRTSRSGRNRDRRERLAVSDRSGSLVA